MAEFFVMPRMNLTMEEGVLTQWYKSEGDSIKVDEPLCSIENEKVTEDVPSLISGTVLKLIGEVGETYPVAAFLAVIGSPGEDISVLLSGAEKKDATGSSTVSTSDPVSEKPVAANAAGQVPIMPKVRKLAKDLGIDLGQLVLFCQGRPITEEEVIAYEKSRQIGKPAFPPSRRKKMSSMRKAIAQNMFESCSRTARLTNFLEVDVTDAFEAIKKLKDAEQEASFTAVVIRACAVALREHPIINTSLDEVTEEILYYDDIHIGFALDIPEGLVVPVIMDADKKDIFNITSEIRQFSFKAREARLETGDLTGGSFTVSNVGMLDVDFFTPIINYPQSAILGVGAVRVLPRYINNDYSVPSPRKILMIGLTYDHRVIDGAPASRFLQSVKHSLETPADLL